MHVFWKRVKRAPSVERGLVELVRANAEEPIDEGKLRRRIARIGEWEAYFASASDSPVFAARYLAEENVLLNVTFPPHRGRERQLVQGVLASYRPNHGEERVWAAFGLDVTLPREMELVEVSPMPAAQRLRFEDRRGHSVVAYRFGMMPEILGGDDEAAFFARLKGRKIILHREGAFRRDDGSDGIVLSYTTRGKAGGCASLLAPTWRGLLYVWRRDDLKRLYGIENHAREGRLIPGLVDRMKSL
jgi:hypothetical protein